MSNTKSPGDVDGDGVPDDVNRAQHISLTMIGLTLVLLHLVTVWLLNVDGVFCNGENGCGIKINPAFVAVDSPFTIGVGFLGGSAFLNRKKGKEPAP